MKVEIFDPVSGEEMIFDHSFDYMDDPNCPKYIYTREEIDSITRDHLVSRIDDVLGYLEEKKNEA